MKSKVLTAAAVLLVVILGIAFQWRYDEAPNLYGRKELVRTNRFTGEVQRLSRTGGWVNSSSTSDRKPDPAATPLPSDHPYADIVNK